MQYYNLYKLVPVLYQTLVELDVIPYREFASPDELREALDSFETILIDVTKRNHLRPQDNQTQRKLYNGKKRHTIKYTVMTTLDKAILFLWKTFAGHTHDYTMLKEEFPPEEAWFAFHQALVDLGYRLSRDCFRLCWQ